MSLTSPTDRWEFSKDFRLAPGSRTHIKRRASGSASLRVFNKDAVISWNFPSGNKNLSPAPVACPSTEAARRLLKHSFEFVYNKTEIRKRIGKQYGINKILQSLTTPADSKDFFKHAYAAKEMPLLIS